MLVVGASGAAVRCVEFQGLWAMLVVLSVIVVRMVVVLEVC